MLKSFKYRIYPGPGQRRKLEATLESCRFLYNHLLAARRDTYDGTGYGLTHYDQCSTLPTLKNQQPHLDNVYSQVLQNVSVRVDLAFKSFFRRVKAKAKDPGFPRFRGKGRYTSFTYPQVGACACIKDGKIRLSKIGLVKAVIHRPLEGKHKTCTISKSPTRKWYVCFSCEVPDPDTLPVSQEVVGIDLGLSNFATLSTQEPIQTPKFFRKEEKALAKVQRKFSATPKDSPLRKKLKKPVARVHERIKWRRQNFCHQESRKIVDRFGAIVLEDLQVNRMVHNHCLAKSIVDAAWTMFSDMTSVKAEWAGRKFVLVNPAYTTQDCSSCGHRQKLLLSEREYHCPCCGLKLDRDYNASLNILRLGLQSLGTAKAAAIEAVNLG